MFWYDSACRAVSLAFTASDNNRSEVSETVLDRLFGRVRHNDVQTLVPHLSDLARRYCFQSNPDCTACPVARFCYHSRMSCLDHNREGCPEFIDLFSGAGGLSLGFEATGFYPRITLDNYAAAIQTFAFNHPNIPDTRILNLGIEEYLTDHEIPQVPLVIGGPPCQGFSNANRQRLSDDPRNILYKYYIDCVARAGARLCILENVPGMLKCKKAVVNDFASIGFMVEAIQLNTQDYGYPQNRKRLFWLGVRTDDIFLFSSIFQFFAAALDADLSAARFNLNDAIRDLPALKAKTVSNSTHLENEEWGFTIGTQRRFDSDFCRLINSGVMESFLFNHRSKYNNERDIEIFSRLQPGEKSDAESIRDIMPYSNRNHIFTDKFFKLEPDRPCKTITAHMYYDCHMYIHPHQARGLTPREAARVQGFPDDYLFFGFPNEWYRQIGNAVSPLMARQVASAVIMVMERFGEELFR